MSILINITSDPIETHHISWHVYTHSSCLVLVEIVENYYEHPESESTAIISKIELVEKKRVLLNSEEAAQLRLLKDILQTINNFYL